MLCKTKWCAVLLSGLLMLTCLAGSAMAEQKMKIKGKRFGVVTDLTGHQVGDVKGHVMSMNASEGVDILLKSTFRSMSYFDGVMPKGGSFQGWSIATFPNGDKNFVKFQGRLEGKRGPGGKPMMLMHGTWKFVSGTGNWAGAQGGGTFKGQYLGKKVYTYDWEGEYTIKK